MNGNPEEKTELISDSVITKYQYMNTQAQNKLAILDEVRMLGMTPIHQMLKILKLKNLIKMVVQ